MDNILQSVFKSDANKRYKLIVYMYSVAPSSEAITLDNNAITDLRYSNELNSLCMTGSFIYTDNFGVLDKFIDKEFAYCAISIKNLVSNNGNDTKFDKESKTDIFSHVFLVNGIEIFDRQKDVIKYKVTLISQNYIKCIASLSYTNYQDKQEPIIDIIKKMITSAGLKIDKKLFDAVKATSFLNYITSTNDNLFTTIEYLLHKLYYYYFHDDSVKFICYNDFDDNYGIFDLMNHQMYQSTTNLILSLAKTNNEGLAETYEQQLATIAKFPKTATINSTITHNMIDYDYSLNSFNTSKVESKQLTNYLNGRNFECKSIIKKYSDCAKFLNSNLNYSKSGAFWNNDFDIYNNAVKILSKDNALVVNTCGDLLRRPGSITNIAIDKSTKQISNSSVDSYKDLMNKYKAFEGQWTIYKTTMFINPKQEHQNFIQNLVLIRNFNQRLN